MKNPEPSKPKTKDAGNIAPRKRDNQQEKVDKATPPPATDEGEGRTRERGDPNVNQRPR